MSFTFRDAKREDTRLLIGLAGGTGAGKTESAMRLATGLAGGKPFAVIDTETGRALHKADDYAFKHGDLTAPFTPEHYWEAISAADAAEFPVIVIDSFSHVWEGVGGVLDMQEAELERMGGSAQNAPGSWIKPKGRHRRLVNQMLQVRAHLVVCMRAQDKIEMVKEGGKTVIRPARSLIGAEGWVPICERRFPHELTLSLLLTQDAPGVPKPIKLESRHAELIPLNEKLSEETGKRLAEWAAGSSAAPVTELAVDLASEPQRRRLFAIAGERGVEKDRLKEILLLVTGQESSAGIPAGLYDAVVAAVEGEQVPA